LQNKTKNITELIYSYVGDFMENLLNILPINIRDKVLEYGNLDKITEIRLRAYKRMHIYYGIMEKITDLNITTNDLNLILRNVSSNSIYSVQNDINNGFISIYGGHRIGVVGEAVLSDGKVKNIKNISSMNIRIAREYVGISENIIGSIFENNKVQNTLIVSPPLCGKTTLLRDIARSISDSGKKITIVDERGEITAMSNGVTSLNIGERTDVISYIPKQLGMQMAVRSMAPDVVFTDEIGTKEDALAIKYLCRSGVSFVATMHGDSIKDIMQSEIKELFNLGYINTVIILSKQNGIGTIDKIYSNITNKMEHIL